MIRRRAAIAGLSLLLVAGVVALWQVALRRLDFFLVRSIEVAGLTHVAERELVAGLAIPPDAHIAIPLAPIAERVRAMPGIREATVARRLPGTLLIEVVEAPAVALTTIDGAVTVLDDRGAVLPIDPARLTESLPLADHDTTLVELLAMLRQVDPQWYRRIERASISGGDVRLLLERRAVVLSVSATPTVLQDLAAVREWLVNRHTNWRQIDARFTGRMFVARSDS